MPTSYSTCYPRVVKPDPLSGTGECYLTFGRYYQRDTFPSEATDERQKRSMASTHVFPVFVNMAVLMAAAVAWLKVYMHYTGYGCAHQVSPPKSLVELDREVANRLEILGSAPGLRADVGPAWSEQVRGIPLRNMIGHRAGARYTRDYLISASPFSCFVLPFTGWTGG